MTTTSRTGRLALAHVLTATGIALDDVIVLRHTYTENGLKDRIDLTPTNLLEYTRRQDVNNKIGKNPPRYWLIFMADGQRRSRLLVAYENHGEVPEERARGMRYFDLRPTDVVSELIGRLVIQWSIDTLNWAKAGALAANFSVIEIADPETVPFPGYDHVLITYGVLQGVVRDSRYATWRTALAFVKGIYVITDTSTGQLYVGKADGSQGIFGRWSTYARDGHGGDKSLRDLTELDPNHKQHFQFSILRVFGPSALTADIDAAESHYKKALLTQQYGLNEN